MGSVRAGTGRGVEKRADFTPVCPTQTLQASGADGSAGKAGTA
jgi:alkyl hydroperoxide reductase subunit AhpC